MTYPINIVFDIGNVICEWNSQKLVNSVFDRDEERESALTNIIGHNDWLMLDKGTLDLQEAIPRATKRSGLQRDQVVRLFKETPISLVPFPETLTVLTILKEQGFNLYVLSNMHNYVFDYLLSKYSFWSQFSGIVISSAVQSIKPEVAIYQHLLRHYKLAAEDTLFLDDLEVNIQAAHNLGIQTLLIQNPNNIRRDLFTKLKGHPLGNAWT